MALFQKKPTTTATSSLYTTGLGSTILVVGLGNVGGQYAKNRHNLGFMVLDRYVSAHDFTPWTEKKDLRCYISTCTIGATRVILIKPTTMMNLSGESAQAVQHFYKVSTSSTIVIHDELDVTFGQLRMRTGGGSAGHNGIKSLSTHIGEDFGRIRVGIGPKKPAQIDSADFVLQDFSHTEQKKLPDVIKEACSIIDEYTATLHLNEETRTIL